MHPSSKAVRITIRFSASCLFQRRHIVERRGIISHVQHSAAHPSHVYCSGARGLGGEVRFEARGVTNLSAAAGARVCYRVSLWHFRIIVERTLTLGPLAACTGCARWLAVLGGGAAACALASSTLV